MRHKEEKYLVNNKTGGKTMTYKYWKQLSPTMRVTKSRYTGQPILEQLNTVYGYYATVRSLSDEDYQHYMSSIWIEYDGPIHPAEERHNNCTTCG
jgi:hypothetical protein